VRQAGPHPLPQNLSLELRKVLEHLDYYLDEFTFRFNRRRSRSRGKLFFRLVQQAMAVEPSTYRSIVNSAKISAMRDHNLLGLPE